MSEITIADAALEAMSPQLLYELLALRIDVFVVEQRCPYSDLDGRDLEPEARLVWATLDNTVVGTLRMLTEGDGARRIGRVVTASAARGRGVGALMMGRALDLAGDRPVVLSAQAHLTEWYQHFGFVRDGEDQLEDGILHTPMRRFVVAED